MKTREQYVNKPLRISELLRSLFEDAPPRTIFDIGACEGLDSIRYSRLFPGARVFAFEPLPENVNRIRASLERFSADAVEIVPEALSDKQGMARFHLSGGVPSGHESDGDWDYGNKSSSLLEPDSDAITTHWPWLEFVGTVDVPTTTLDTFCETRGCSPDFMHLDVQGAELQVLSGGQEIMNSVSAIWMEVSLTEVYRGQPLAGDVRDYMSERQLVELISLPEGPQADVLYVRESLAHRVPQAILDDLIATVPAAPEPIRTVAKPTVFSRMRRTLLGS